jgi:lipopolysaccharide/colanic/teichoic acid biosynthesis glycosyltransferase
MIRLFREPLSNGLRLVKRSFDLIISAAAIGLLFPFWLLIAILIKLDSKGPIFYTQERVGMDGRLFLLYKFRTMQAGADPDLHREYQQAFIAGRAEANLGDVNRPTYKLLADPRITRIGKTLRRMSLDEVPQLLNVLMGDMSLVGPRPPIPYEVEAYELWHRKRLDMKPGLTGLWQVSGRNRLPFEEMVRLDLFYIENWSLLLDVKIILRTGFVMLGGEGF